MPSFRYRNALHRAERCAWPASTRSAAGRWRARWWPRSPSSTARVAKRKLLRLIDDSKKLMLEEREEAYEAMLVSGVVRYRRGRGERRGDRPINILQATFLAMRRALQAMAEQPDLVLIDGNQVPPELGCRAETIVGGDARSYSIAAASIFAKVTRDRYMRALAASFPGYGWETNRRLRLPRASSPASTGSAPRCTTAGASRRSCACSNLGCRWRNRERTRGRSPD